MYGIRMNIKPSCEEANPHAAYTIRIDSHQTGFHLEIEMDALPYAARTYHIRVKGEEAVEKR